MTFEELVSVRSVEDLNSAARELLDRLNRIVTNQGFAGSAHCYALPLATVVAEIARRKRNTAEKVGADVSKPFTTED